MARRHQITINGHSFFARRGEVLLDAALNNGIDLPYDCHAGHCRIVDDAVIEKDQASGIRTVEGVLSSLRPLSPEVMEVGIKTRHALPYHPGQYAQVRFRGYPSRPFSITHPLHDNPNSRS